MAERLDGSETLASKKRNLVCLERHNMKTLLSCWKKAICVCKYKTEVSFPISQHTGKSDGGMSKRKRKRAGKNGIALSNGHFGMRLRIYCWFIRCGMPIMAYVSKVGCRLSLRARRYTCAGPSQGSLSRHCTLMKHPNWIQWTTQCLLTSANYCPTGSSLVRGLRGWRVRGAVLGIKEPRRAAHAPAVGEHVTMWLLIAAEACLCVVPARTTGARRGMKL